MDGNVDLGSRSKKATSVDHFHEEILAEILPRLPVKSVIKFTRVCKSWNSLIKSCTFADNYLSRSLLIQSDHYTKNDGRQLFLLKQIGGMYYSSALSYYKDNPNPRFGGAKFTELLKPPTLDDINRRYEILRMTNDYKVLRIVSIFRHVKIEVYSLAKGYWKSPRSSFPAYFMAVHVFENVFVNGALHWILPRDRNLDEYLIVSFDLGTELFHKITMPEALRKKGSNCYVLRRGESLALIEIESTFLDNERHFVHQLHLWVMKEYGDVKSWIKLDSVGLQGIDRPRPLCFKSRDELVITMFDCNRQQTAVVVDMAKETATCQEHCYSSSMDPFVESLVLLNHPNALSY
ncbi:hypothetical protein DVH24_041114 [Malus domestica]|uniref:F-box domain-containing protein n=1 Tax=Malus domestica TaxID=3750 RepID=A0A498ID74_MALDO|nr:hypothetical protein DVH24_041114 [Malus domestica]